MRVFNSIEELAQMTGQEIGVSDWILIDQARVNAFADATGDHQWIHVDVERARRELPSKDTIVHGFLTLSLMGWLVAGISRLDGVSRQINYGLNKVRFPTALKTGTRVRAHQKLLSTAKRAGGTELVFEITIEIEGEERPACLAEIISIAYPKLAEQILG
jgi:acyl dehydratase